MSIKKLYTMMELDELAKSEYRGKFINYFPARYGMDKDNKKIMLFEIESVTDKISPGIICIHYHL